MRYHIQIYRSHHLLAKTHWKNMIFFKFINRTNTGHFCRKKKLDFVEIQN